MIDTHDYGQDVLLAPAHAQTPLRVLLSPNPEWGGVMPFFPLAQALREAGHTVVFSGPPPNEFFLRQCGVDLSQIIRAIEDRGFEYVTVFRSMADHPAPAAHAGAEPGSAKCWMGLFRLLNGLLPGLIDDIEQLIRTRSIDVALVDAFVWYEAIASARCDLPIALVKTNLRVPINLRMPPSRSRLVPGGIGSQVAILYAWAKIWLYWNLLLPWAKHLRPLYDATRQIQRRAAAAGLTTTLTDYFPEFVLPEVTLCPAAFDFFPVPGRFYAALLGARPNPEAFVWPSAPGATKRIYCTAGTLTRQFEDGTDERMLRMCLAAFEGRPDISVILQVVDPALRGSLRNVPGNTTVVPWVPQRDVLCHADLAIIAGGLGTIKECIAAGVPMLVTAPPHADKPGNAMRVEFHRVGRQVNLLDTSPEEIARLIDDLFEHRDMWRANMRPIQDELLDPDGPRRLVQYVESLGASRVAAR